MKQLPFTADKVAVSFRKIAILSGNGDTLFYHVPVLFEDGGILVKHLSFKTDHVAVVIRNVGVLMRHVYVLFETLPS